jgi:hypothetical protein
LLASRQRFWAPTQTASGARGLESCLSSLLHQLLFEFGQRGKDMEGQFAADRFRINRFMQAL